MNKRRPRRAVIVSNLVPRRGRPRLWGYGYADLALLLGCSEAAVRQLAARRVFDPACLGSVFALWRARSP